MDLKLGDTVIKDGVAYTVELINHNNETVWLVPTLGGQSCWLSLQEAAEQLETSPPGVEVVNEIPE